MAEARTRFGRRPLLQHVWGADALALDLDVVQGGGIPTIGSALDPDLVARTQSDSRNHTARRSSRIDPPRRDPVRGGPLVYHLLADHHAILRFSRRHIEILNV